MPNHIHGIIAINNIERGRCEVSSPYPKRLTFHNRMGGETPPLQEKNTPYKFMLICH